MRAAARTVGWAGATLLVLGGHAGAALWVMHARPEPLPPAGQPIFVDLAPPPPAPDFSVPESGLALSGPVTGLPTPPPPDFEVPESTLEPPEPLTEIAEPLPPEVELPPIEPLPAFDAAALLPPPVTAERPAPRPKRVERPREPEPRKPEPEKPRETRRTETRPQPQAPAAPPAGTRATASEASSRPAAQASGAGKGAGAKAQASWRATASAVVARHMQRGRYSTREVVSATISLTVDGAGRITGASASSGGGALDAALTRQIRRLGRLPAPPGGQGLAVVVPVRITP